MTVHACTIIYSEVHEAYCNLTFTTDRVAQECTYILQRYMNHMHTCTFTIQRYTNHAHTYTTVTAGT